MNKRAYIFCFILLILGFFTAYQVGVRIGSVDSPVLSEKEADVSPDSEESTAVQGYWVKAVNDIIFVYKYDKTSVVAETDINVSGLSEQEQHVLEHGVYLETAEELFKYLEANTS